MAVFAIRLLLAVGALPGATAAPAAPQTGTVSVRTEHYPRPPYSGATYYVYERDGAVICTKLEVCNKYDDCTTHYAPGPYLDAEDRETGEPFATTAPVPIAASKLGAHVCLTKFKRVAPH